MPFMLPVAKNSQDSSKRQNNLCPVQNGRAENDISFTGIQPARRRRQPMASEVLSVGSDRYFGNNKKWLI
jgi:hypothetical protein